MTIAPEKPLGKPPGKPPESLPRKLPGKPVLALTGATGFVGGVVLQQALAAGWRVRALTRKTQKTQDNICWIRGALDDSGALARLVRGSDVVLHVAAVVNAAQRKDFEKTNVAGTAAIIAAAQKVGISGFVHVSSLAARAPRLSDYGWSKARAEEKIRESSLSWTIVRPPAVFGPGDTEMLDLFRMARFGVVLLPPSGRISVIMVSELARLLLALAKKQSRITEQTGKTEQREQIAEQIAGKIYEADDGRRNGWSHRSFARAIGKAMGRGTLFTIAAPESLLLLAARLDTLVRRKNAKLTLDRARYIAHPDWVIADNARPPERLWQPMLETHAALEETVRWYRRCKWL